jgi:hypothetical protein
LLDDLIRSETQICRDPPILFGLLNLTTQHTPSSLGLSTDRTPPIYVHAGYIDGTVEYSVLSRLLTTREWVETDGVEGFYVIAGLQMGKTVPISLTPRRWDGSQSVSHRGALLACFLYTNLVSNE